MKGNYQTKLLPQVLSTTQPSSAISYYNVVQISKVKLGKRFSQSRINRPFSTRKTTGDDNEYTQTSYS